MFGRGTRTPKLEVTEIRPDVVKFVLYGTDVSMANALRRIMVAEVPCLAIELVSLEENTSVFHDEVLAHRFGLLPIDSTRIQEFRFKEECPCTDKCRSCAVDFHVDVTCKHAQGLTVTHHDLMKSDPDMNAPVPVPRDDDPNNPSSGIVICKLGKNQKLKCHLTAVKGIGKLHSKWSPVATATYSYEADVVINKKVAETMKPSEKATIAASCPRSVFVHQDDPASGISSLEVGNRMNCIFCEECTSSAKLMGYPDLLKISQVTDRFQFTVESTGCMPAHQIVELALSTLGDKLQLLSGAVAKAAHATRPPGGDQPHAPGVGMLNLD